MLVPGGGKKAAAINDEMACGSVVDAARNSLYCPTSLDQPELVESESGSSPKRRTGTSPKRGGGHRGETKPGTSPRRGFEGAEKRLEPKPAPRHASGIPRAKPRSGEKKLFLSTTIHFLVFQIMKFILR